MADSGSRPRRMSEAAGERQPRAQQNADHEVVVIGAGQAGLAMGYYLAGKGAGSSSLERGDSDRACVARALGLADALHAAALQRAAGPSLPRRPGRLPDARRGDRLPRALRGDVRAPDRAQQRRAQAFPARTGASSSSSTGGRSRPTRSWSRPGPFQTPYVPKLAGGARPRASGRRTAPATGGRATFPRERCSSSGAGTPASRSPRSSRRPTRSSSRSALGRSRCRSGSPAATSSGG